MRKILGFLVWSAVALLGAVAYTLLAFHDGAQAINSATILTAALCTYAIGYRFYSKWIAARVLALNDQRATPCEAREDSKDFVKTNKWIVFGHHFAAISGPGPLVGPVLASQFGYLPGTLWILIGVVLGGAVQDFVILFCSMRRDGKSLGRMVKEELNPVAGYLALVAILAIMVILLAVLGLVVVQALGDSPWGVFTVGATIPIAMFMGGYLRYGRVGKVTEASAVGVVLLLLAVWGGRYVQANAGLAHFFKLDASSLAWCLVGYGLAASVLPVWLLLAPRDYLSSFMKLGTIFALALGIFLTLPAIHMPAVTKFTDGTGLVVAGKLFPFCFITIACGSISGFHALISSGTTPKIIAREKHARSVGYGAMCLESLVAIMALIAACTMEPGVYFSINVKGAPAEVTAKVSALGFPVKEEQMQALAATIGEKTVVGRTGGAATLAVGMAKIFSGVARGRGLDLWYHFAIMFEALFILTTLDAGTRVGRYMLQDLLGRFWKPLGDTRRLDSTILASGLLVGSWGWFLIQGVKDPLGGINSLWPLFGIANQLLAAIALCLATTVILKMEMRRGDATNRPRRTPRPTIALVTLVPLLWLLAVTLTAGTEKIASPNPRIGFLAAADGLDKQLPGLEKALEAAKTASDAKAIETAQKAVHANRGNRFNYRLDTVVTAAFLSMVALIVLLAAYEWIRLLQGARDTAPKESAPVWLPEHKWREPGGVPVLGCVALAAALARELSAEAEIDRHLSRTQACSCRLEEAREKGRASATPGVPDRDARVRAYVEMTERKFKGINRCC
jgi:carbon starvation protein